MENKILNSIDKEAKEKALWLKDYCSKHLNECTGCVFNDEENRKIHHDGQVCILQRNSPEFWFKVYKARIREGE